jgi:hypothetical protein
MHAQSKTIWLFEIFICLSVTEEEQGTTLQQV